MGNMEGGGDGIRRDWRWKTRGRKGVNGMKSEEELPPYMEACLTHTIVCLSLSLLTPYLYSPSLSLFLSPSSLIYPLLPTVSRRISIHKRTSWVREGRERERSIKRDRQEGRITVVDASSEDSRADHGIDHTSKEYVSDRGREREEGRKEGGCWGDYWGRECMNDERERGEET